MTLRKRDSKASKKAGFITSYGSKFSSEIGEQLE
jgi:hypothetical protein